MTKVILRVTLEDPTLKPDALCEKIAKLLARVCPKGEVALVEVVTGHTWEIVPMAQVPQEAPTNEVDPQP